MLLCFCYCWLLSEFKKKKKQKVRTLLNRLNRGLLNSCLHIDHVFIFCPPKFFYSWAVITQIVSPAAAANLGPRPRRGVSTHPSSEKIYVTLLPHFPETWPDITPVCGVRPGERHIRVRVAPGWPAAWLLPSLLFRQWRLCSVYFCVNVKAISPLSSLHTTTVNYPHVHAGHKISTSSSKGR